MNLSQFDNVDENNYENTLGINDTQKDEMILPVSLLEERLVVSLDRHKVGEIIVRKEIETQIIEVPIRREKLIIEQLTPEYKQIAIVDLPRDEASLTKINEEISVANSESIVKGEFESVKLASQFLGAIASFSEVGSTRVKIEIKVEDISTQKLYQKLLEDFLEQLKYVK